MRNKKQRMIHKNDSSSSSSDMPSSSDDENTSRHLNPLVPSRVLPRELDDAMKNLSLGGDSSEEEKTKIDFTCKNRLMNSHTSSTNVDIDDIVNDVVVKDVVYFGENFEEQFSESAACTDLESFDLRKVKVESETQETLNKPRPVTVNNEADYLIYPEAYSLINELPVVTEISQFISAKKVIPLAHTKWNSFAKNIEGRLKALVLGTPLERANSINRLVTVRQIDEADPRECLRGQDGVFANNEIPKGTVITHYVGAIVSDSKELFTHDGIALREHMCKKNCGGSEQLGRYAFDIALSEENHLMIDAVGHGSNIGCKINDGCGSNNTEFFAVCLPGTKIPIVSVISTVEIPKGAEILIDYGKLSEIRINKHKAIPVDNTSHELSLTPFISWSDRFVFRQNDKRWVLFLTEEDKLIAVRNWLLDRGLDQSDIETHLIEHDSVFDTEICLSETSMNSLRKSVEKIRQAAFESVRRGDLEWMNQYPDLYWYSGYDENGHTPMLNISNQKILSWFKSGANYESLNQNDLFALTKYREFEVVFYESDKSKKFMHMPWIELLEAIYAQEGGRFFSPFSIIKSQHSENPTDNSIFDVAEYILIKQKLRNHEIDDYELIVHILMRPYRSIKKPLEKIWLDKNNIKQIVDLPRDYRLAELMGYALTGNALVCINNVIYEGADISHISLQHIKFKNCTFRNLILKNVNFHERCRGLTFQGCFFSRKTLHSILESGARKLSGNTLVFNDSGKENKIPLIDASSNASIDDYLNKLPGYRSAVAGPSQRSGRSEDFEAGRLEQSGLFSSSKPTAGSSGSHTSSRSRAVVKPARYRR